MSFVNDNKPDQITHVNSSDNEGGFKSWKKNEGGFKDFAQNEEACLLAILKQELLDFQILGFCSRCFQKNLAEQMV